MCPRWIIRNSVSIFDLHDFPVELKWSEILVAQGVQASTMIFGEIPF
jgi:hypothetical protein